MSNNNNNNSGKRYVRPVCETLNLRMVRSDKSIPWGVTLVEEQWKAHTVKPGSAAERCGVRAGDIIVSVQGVPVSSPLVKELMTSQMSLLLVIERQMAPPAVSDAPTQAHPVHQQTAAPRPAVIQQPPVKQQPRAVAPPPPPPQQQQYTRAAVAPEGIAQALLMNLAANETFLRNKMTSHEGQGRQGIEKEFSVKPALSQGTLRNQKRAEVEDRMRRVRQKREAEEQQVKALVAYAFGAEPPFKDMMSYIKSKEAEPTTA